MLFVLLIIYGIVHYEFVPQEQTLNQLYYFYTLEHVGKHMVKMTCKVKSGWFLHHVSIAADSALLVHAFLASNKMTVISRPLYSSTSLLCNSFLF